MSQVFQPAPVETRTRAWLVVLGSTLALMVGNGPIILFTFGVLVGPITAEFHWPRSTLAAAVVAAHTAGALAMPFVGRLIDRFGVRRVTLPAIAAFSIVLASIALLPAVPLYFVLAYAVLGLVGAAHSTLAYARAVATWFDGNRGLALGVTLSGVGLGTALLPQVARLLVADYGWRGAYCGLAAVLFAIGFPAVALLVRDRDAVVEAPDLRTGLTLREALRGFHFWAIGAALFLVAIVVNGTIAHIVPLLGDRGISPQAATAVMSATGFALILGRILSGYCLDRFFAPHVSAGFFLVPLCGVALFACGAAGVWAMLAAVLLGIGLGAEVDIMAFLVGRYFGLAHYGAIYGTLLALFTFGSGLGPWLMASSFDHLHAYTAALVGFGSILVVAGCVMLRLGPYRYR